MKKPTAIDYICASVAVMLIGVLLIVMCAGCGHNVGIVGIGTGFRAGGPEYGINYGEGLFGTFCTRDGVRFKAEIDSTTGFSYDPTTNSYKGIRSVEYSLPPQINGYAVDFAKDNPDVAKAYYDAMIKYYEAESKATPATPLISDEKSKSATKSVTDVIKAAIEKAKAIIDEDGESADQGGEGGEEDSDFRCDGDCNYDDLTGNASISWQLSVALKLLSFDGYQRKFPSSDEYYQTAMEHFVSQLVSLRSLGKKTTPLRIKYVTVENKVVTRLMFAYIPKQGTPSEVECPSCWFVNPDDAD